jgi:hypothetical protein
MTMCAAWCTRTQIEHGNKLRAGVNGQPQPEQVCRAAQPRAQFIQLEVRDPEMAKGALVEGLSVLASTGQPGRDGGLSKAKGPQGLGRVQPFGQRREHQGDLL